ncbi:MAG: hypothetical protein ABSC46_03980 [Candidatus Limnocylindrales bacterium]|jgi:hypothetical protein
MPIASKCWKWCEPRVRSGPIGVRALIVAVLAVGGFFYVLFGPLVYDIAYWLLGRMVRVQADRRLRIGVSLVLAVVYLASMEYIGLNEKQSTQPGATSTPVAAASSTSPATSIPAAATPTLTATIAPTATPVRTPSSKATATVAPSPTAAKPIVLGGNSKTGVSNEFTLAAGTYKVAWSATADTAGCDFALILSTKPNGPAVKSTSAILPEAKDYTGDDLWTNVPAGSYVLYEDWTGLLNCKGLWSATLSN